MSRNFLHIRSAPIRGAGAIVPITLCEPTQTPPSAVPFHIIWSIFDVGTALPDMALNVNLQPAQNTLRMDKIKSVYIDNLGSDVPIYVYFPSTNFTVPAQPNSCSWYPVITNDYIAVIIAEGFTDATRNAVTDVFFSNLQMQPYVSNELPKTIGLGKVSSAISRGTTIFNTNYDAPALGDTLANFTIALNIGTPTTLFNPANRPANANFLYIHSCNIFASGFGNDPTGVQITYSIAGVSAGVLFSGGLAGQNLLVFPPQNAQLQNLTAMNVKLLATDTITYIPAGVMSNGTMNITLCYTYNPN